MAIFDAYLGLISSSVHAKASSSCEPKKPKHSEPAVNTQTRNRRQLQHKQKAQEAQERRKTIKNREDNPELSTLEILISLLQLLGEAGSKSFRCNFYKPQFGSSQTPHSKTPKLRKHILDMTTQYCKTGSNIDNITSVASVGLGHWHPQKLHLQLQQTFEQTPNAVCKPTRC